LLSLSIYAQHLETIGEITSTNVFHHPSVVGIRIAGYEVLGKLLAEFVDAVLGKSKKGKFVYHIMFG
jgi:dGTPase